MSVFGGGGGVDREFPFTSQLQSKLRQNGGLEISVNAMCFMMLFLFSEIEARPQSINPMNENEGKK